MLRESESISRAASKSPTARTCGNSKPELRKIFSLVRTIVPKPHGKWLQKVTGAAPRTTEYWLSGRYQPRGDQTFAIVQALRSALDEHSRTLEQFELGLR